MPVRLLGVCGNGGSGGSRGRGGGLFFILLPENGVDTLFFFFCHCFAYFRRPYAFRRYHPYLLNLVCVLVSEHGIRREMGVDGHAWGHTNARELQNCSEGGMY